MNIFIDFNEYLQLIKDFLSFKINDKTFESKFYSMVEAIEEKCRLLTKNYEMLKNIKPSSILIIILVFLNFTRLI